MQKHLHNVVAWLGPVGAVALVTGVALRGSGARFLYIASGFSTVVVRLWLMIRLVESLWDASRDTPRLAGWITRDAADGTSRSRLRVVSHKWTTSTLRTAVVLLLLAWVAHIPVGLAGGLVVAMAMASLVMAFDLVGWLVGQCPSRTRYGVRIALGVLGVGAVAAWLHAVWIRGLLPDSPVAALMLPVSLAAWQWFLPARWVIALVESLANGGGFLAHLVPPVVCAVALVGLYVRRTRVDHLRQPEVASSPVGSGDPPV